MFIINDSSYIVFFDLEETVQRPPQVFFSHFKNGDVKQRLDKAAEIIQELCYSVTSNALSFRSNNGSRL